MFREHIWSTSHCSSRLCLSRKDSGLFYLSTLLLELITILSSPRDDKGEYQEVQDVNGDNFVFGTD